ncbi:MAG TPA: hypothetical protein VFW07_24865 [Parafilimonas sp.]|nr:hypothetical protein [Parafilimonas sp.]
MKQSFLKGIKKNALLIIAVAAFVIFEGNKKIESNNDVASRCCTGYNIDINKLKKFMVDSLHGDQFEGGVYSKSALLTAINAIPGDSIYLMNVLKNCSASQGTDLVLTSPQAGGVVFISKPGCNPCPGKPCCNVKKVCVSRIDRQCINYKIFKGFTATPATGVPNAEQ